MVNDQVDLLPENIISTPNKKRKDLLPVWIKIFAWIFLIFGLATPVSLFFGVLGSRFQLSLYGFQSDDPFSLIGIGLIILFFFKGVVSFGLLKQKDWAIKLGIVDAVLGIALCCFAMLFPFISSQSHTVFLFRLELIALIPYLKKLMKIKNEYENIIQ